MTMTPSACRHHFLLLLLLISSVTVSLIAAQPLYYVCGTTGNFTANSTYQTNLNRLLSSLSVNAPTSGFANATVGEIPDLVIGLALCRGDVKTTECRACLNTATQDAQQVCPFDRASMIWYDFCFLRFSNVQFLGSTSNDQELLLGNTAYVSDPQRFNRLLNLLLNSTLDRAARSGKRFATGVVNKFTEENPTVYGLVQCLPSLSASQCRQCVRALYVPLPSFLEGRQGGRVLRTICTMRYEIYSFFEGSPKVRLTVPLENAPPPPPPPPPAVPSP